MSDDILDRLRLKFTSGNSVPVERATITREEFEGVEMLVALLRKYLEESYACNKRINNDFWKLRVKINASPTAVVGPAETDVYKTWNADATCEIEVSEPFSTLKETELPAAYAGKRVRIVLMEQDQENSRQYIG